MKAIITLMLCCTIYCTASATIHVVDNNINNTTVFALFQDAVDAAADFDTIYVQPSNIIYDDIIANKPLVIFGAGRRPNKQNQSRSKVSEIYLITGSSGTSIHGMKITTMRSAENVNNITISHSHMDYLEIIGDNFFVENCVISRSGGINYSIRVLTGANNTPRNNLVFQNNIIRGGIREMTGSGCVFRNNLFIPSNNYFFVFYETEPANSVIVENNIFYGTAPTSCFVCTFSNNITFSTTQDSLPYGNNSGENNIVWLQNNFVDADLPIGNFVNNIYVYDLEIIDGEPGSDAGLDGNDIGLFGGAIPFSYAGEPNIPVIRSFVLENASVPVDGNLQIQVILSAPE